MFKKNQCHKSRYDFKILQCLRALNEEKNKRIPSMFTHNQYIGLNS